MPLTDLQVKNLKPSDRPYKRSDFEGLYVLVKPNGSKLWQMKYRYHGVEKTYSIGKYPDVSLNEAREKKHLARKLIAQGLDPTHEKKREKIEQKEIHEHTFEKIAWEWFRVRSIGWHTNTAKKNKRFLERDILPTLGRLPITSVKPPDILKMLKPVEARNAIDTLHRLKSVTSQVFRFAISLGVVDSNPAADIGMALPKKNVTHRAALTEPSDVSRLLKAIDSYSGSLITISALKLAPLVFLRPGELVNGRWEEIDFKNNQWIIPGSRMKMNNDHIVPLSRQACEILKALHPVTGQNDYLFPGRRSTRRPISNNTLNAAIRNMGFGKDEMTAQGFRAMARTMLDERLKVRPDLIEHQLSHAVKDPNRRAYNRTSHIEERRLIMQQWADYLDTLRGKKAIGIKKKKERQQKERSLTNLLLPGFE